jgi:hypothetical protein
VGPAGASPRPGVRAPRAGLARHARRSAGRRHLPRPRRGTGQGGRRGPARRRGRKKRVMFLPPCPSRRGRTSPRAHAHLDDTGPSPTTCRAMFSPHDARDIEVDRVMAPVVGSAACTAMLQRAAACRRRRRRTVLERIGAGGVSVMAKVTIVPRRAGAVAQRRNRRPVPPRVRHARRPFPPREGAAVAPAAAAVAGADGVLVEALRQVEALEDELRRHRSPARATVVGEPTGRNAGTGDEL